MARSLSNVKAFVSLVAHNMSVSFQRRGYAAASQGVPILAKRSGAIGQVSKKDLGGSSETSWVPDSVTGYYRPANRVQEIDAAQLREKFLKQKIRSH